MVLSRSGQKWSGKCMVHGLIDTIPRTKTKKHSHYENISPLFFPCSVS